MKLFYIALAFMYCFASTAFAYDEDKFQIFEYKSLHKGLAEFRFQVMPKYAADFLVITEIDGNLIQEFQVNIGLQKPYLTYLDINDDGYLDVLFYDNEAGMCCGATDGADVFIYNPKLKHFDHNKTLSGQGGITKTTKGCVNVNYKSSQGGYTDDEYCLIPKTKRWKLKHQNVSEPGPG